jgi:4-amino-4-deoxy-L-arabinose transferase-like glycosyltransferase
MAKPDGARRPFAFWLGVWTALGLAIRLGTVFGRLHRKGGGDPAYFHGAANLLVGGHGFINPWVYAYHDKHHVVQTANWPPLFVFLLAIPAVLGFHTFLASRVFSCLIGAAAILVTGFAGREIGGRRVGLIAAFLLTVYPNIWDSDEIAGVEALTPLLIALIFWTAYRLWRKPTPGRALALGASIGVAALGRDELALLLLLIFVPVVLLCRSVNWRKRGVLLLSGVGIFLLVVMPWIGYNLSRFEKPVFISSGFGPTLASANCATTYSGPLEGYWSIRCIDAVPQDRHVDESVNAAHDESFAIKFIEHHEDRIVPVTLARIGRGFGFFHPLQQVRLDAFVETRPYRWALGGLGMYYLFLVLSVGGSFVMRRRRIPAFPLWAVGVDAVVSMILAFGQTRYRTSFESSLVILSAVQLEWIWSRIRSAAPPAEEADSGAAPSRELVAASV